MAALVLASAQAAMAGYTVYTGDYGPYQSGSGGEFTLEAGGSPTSLSWVLGYYTANTKGYSNGSSLNTFQTFCIETNEFTGKYTTFDADLSSAAKAGGVGGGSPDPISKGTAYLYSQFAAGTLKDTALNLYDYLGTRTGDAAALQNAIWMLENEIGWNAGNKYIAKVLTIFGNQAGAQADSGGLYGVKALNLTLNGAYKQDMLVVTPIPGAVWLLGSGLLGLLGFKRKVVG